MNKTALKKSWVDYATYASFERIAKIVEAMEEVLGEPVTAVLPNIHLGQDGPHLASIFLVSDRLVAERSIAGNSEGESLDEGPDSAQGREVFDVCGLHTVWNYRVWTGSKNTLLADGSVQSYRMGRVTIHHNANDFTSEIHYAGLKRTAWFAAVFQALPILLVAGVEGKAAAVNKQRSRSPRSRNPG